MRISRPRRPAHISSAELEDLLLAANAEIAIPGIGISAQIADRIVSASIGKRSRATGAPMHSGVRFQLGCAVQLLLAGAALTLSEQGLLFMDDPIERYIRTLRFSRAGRSITLRHLLSHTAGYVGVSALLLPDLRTWTAFSRYLKQCDFLFVPGSVYDYHLSNIAVAAKVVELAVRCPVGELLQSLFLRPLQIQTGTSLTDACCVAGHHRTSATEYSPIDVAAWQPSDFWRLGASSITVALPDLCRLLDSLLLGSAGANASPLLSDAARRQLVEPAIHIAPPINSAKIWPAPKAFGIGCATFADGSIGANGAGAGQCLGLRVHSTSRIVVAVGMNSDSLYARNDILARFWSRVLNPSPGAEPPARTHPVELSDFEGIYSAGGSSVVICQRVNDDLLLRVGSRHAGVTLRIGHTDQGRLAMLSRNGLWSVALFYEPTQLTPSLMIGQRAYRQMSRDVNAEVGSLFTGRKAQHH